MAPQLETTHALQVTIVQLSLETVFGTTHIHSTHLAHEKVGQRAKYFGATRTTYEWELRWLSLPQYS
jgi:hypothetical protein